MQQAAITTCPPLPVCNLGHRGDPAQTGGVEHFHLLATERGERRIDRTRRAENMERGDVAGRDEQLGLRERNKLDKLRRIKAAAGELFVSKGYDETTTREIAARADVGMGTLFLYADNKRDLLFLIANDELDVIISAAPARLRSDRPVLANLIATYKPIYELFCRQPPLSRMTLREMTFYDKGRQAKRFNDSREQLIAVITRIMQMGQERKEIESAETPAFIGWVAFCIYQVELRRWLQSDQPDLTKGLKRLERALKLLLDGAAIPSAQVAAPKSRKPYTARKH